MAQPFVTIIIHSNYFINMKYLLFTICLILNASNLFAQFSLRFLENQEGIKSIESTVKSGEKDTPKVKNDNTKSFDKEGRLEKYVMGSGATFEYIYEDNMVFEIIQYKRDDCKTAIEYLLEEDGKTLTIKSKYHEGKWKPENSCGRYESARDLFGADATRLFPDVKRTIPLEDYYDFIYIINYTNEGKTDEYEVLFYRGSKRWKRYSLYSIEQMKKDDNGNYLKTNFGVESYGQKRVVLSNQVLLDPQGFQLKYIGEREFYQPDGKNHKRYNYKNDDKGNWTKQNLIAPDSKTILERERTINYY